MLKNELYKAFINKRFLLVLFIETLLIVWYTIGEAIPLMNEYMLPLNEHFITWEYPDKMANRLPHGAYYMWIVFKTCKQRVLLYAILPILAAIPYGESLFVEKSSHYTYHLLMKKGKIQYYTAKLITLFVSGGTVAMFPFLLSFLINAAIMPLESVSSVTGQFFASSVIFSDIFYKEPLLYIVLHILITFVCYGMLNCFCFVGTYFLNNRFVVMLFPFILYYVSGYIESAIFSSSSIVPWYSFRIRNVLKIDIAPIMVVILTIIAIILVAYLFKCRKKGDEL